MRQNKQAGFTLIEIILVIVIIGIIAGTASSMLGEGLNAFLTANNVTDADWQGQIAIQRMERDIRAVRSAADISTASTNQFAFVNNTGTSITYTLSGSNLLRNSQTLATGVQTLAFAYSDLNGNSTATPSAIRFVSVTLNVTQKKANYNLTTSINLRDLL